MYERVKKSLADYPDFMEMIDPEWLSGLPEMFICGSGHVARAICKLAVDTDFQVTVIDSHEETMIAENFPDSVRLVLDEPANLGKYLTKGGYGIIASGHDAGTTEGVRSMFRAELTYRGMLLSRKASAGLRELLLKEGFPREAVDSFHCPIGLPIHSITPKEMAVSVLAEVIQTKNETMDVSIVSSDLLHCKDPGCLCMIVAHEGHTPRKTGSMMFVTRDKFYDSVGGNYTERIAIEKARAITTPCVEQYDLGRGWIRILFIPMWEP